MSEVLAGEHDAEELLGQLGSLVAELEQHPDAEVREKALDLVQIIVKLHGEALRRILATFESLPLKSDIYARMLGDDVIRAILTVHDLLPEELEARVAKAIEELRPFLISQGCDVKFLGVDGGRAQLRLMRSGKGAPPVAALKLEIEKVLDVAAPDLLGIDIEGMTEMNEAAAKAAAMLGAMIAPPRTEAPPAPAKLVQIKRPRPDATNVDGTWVSIVRALGFEDGQFKVISYEEINLLVCKLGGEFYAYRNACAEGGRPLGGALFESPMLTCACHGYVYDLRRGLCVGKPGLRLASLPLKVEDDKVKVALPRG
ncbi:MAG: Rieske (2Fe-2S) protein [Acidobacteria bacterium]|nr:Rieske (2Fe-2S) protein [Acidobacteriota bacterium]MCA1640853.1 Rieske (2Fe-2S) protein [Acidobacteriota bacterium]